MKKMLVFTLLSLLLFAKPVFANEQFDTSYAVKYTVQATGETLVEQEITIKNNQDDVLATTYSHAVNQMAIYDVTAKDRKGDIAIDRKDENGVTTIKLTLNEQVIGKDRENVITLAYKTADIAGKVGGIWNLNLPQISGLGEINDYSIKVIIPKTFGPEIFMSPTPTQKTENGETVEFSFVKKALENTGITAAFGVYQTVNYKLNYHLANTSWFPVVQEIALPPDIAGFQQVQLENIKPYPLKMYLDGDKNLMAQYRIPGGKDIAIEVTGAARISGKQINPQMGGLMHEIPRSIAANYTQAQLYWESDSPQIKQLADELLEPQKTVAENARKIYDYITGNFDYNFEVTAETFVDRRGALGALENPTQLACMEFTDLFIAIARSMGIPARELNGFAFNNADTINPLAVDLKSSDTLHSWPEFYDPTLGWVMIDPTWGATSGIDYFTKLDTNHFVFAIKGLDSEYPYPAGSYKLTEDEKQVAVDFAQAELTSKEFVTLYKKTGIFNTL